MFYLRLASAGSAWYAVISFTIQRGTVAVRYGTAVIRYGTVAVRYSKVSVQ